MCIIPIFFVRNFHLICTVCLKFLFQFSFSNSMLPQNICSHNLNGKYRLENFARVLDKGNLKWTTNQLVTSESLTWVHARQQYNSYGVLPLIEGVTIYIYMRLSSQTRLESLDQLSSKQIQLKLYHYFTSFKM